MECVPNYSEGRDLVKFEKIVDAFRGREGVKLLDYSSDKDHNRSVITVIGEPEALAEAVIDSIGRAVELIDLTQHEGQHPRMGVADVVPFIPIRGCSIEDADRIAKYVAKTVGEKFGYPSFLYEYSASAPHRANLADVRRGQFEGLAEKMRDPLWQPDFGPRHPHPTAGAGAIGAREALIAYNINLDTSNVEIAKAIARRVRHINGGFRYVKAMGVLLRDRNVAQVSMNLVNYNGTAVYQVFEAVKSEARRYGVNVIGSELIGLVPMKALLDCAEYYLQIENFSMDKVLEARF